MEGSWGRKGPGVEREGGAGGLRQHPPCHPWRPLVALRSEGPKGLGEAAVRRPPRVLRPSPPSLPPPLCTLCYTKKSQKCFVLILNLLFPPILLPLPPPACPLPLSLILLHG